MTPLAQRILNDLLKPEGERQFRMNNSHRDVAWGLLEARPFEMSAVAELIPPLGFKMYEVTDGVMGGLQEQRYAFLPAPTTWLEYGIPEMPGQRIGVLLEEAGEFSFVTICFASRDYFGVVADSVVPIAGNDELGVLKVPTRYETFLPAGWEMSVLRDVYPMLAMINTPTVVAQRTHPPHAGLARNVRAKLGLTAQLQPWHEVRLQIDAPSGSGGENQRLVGKKALHFCRQHLRVRLGRLELVRSHWRGDAALGVSNTRYTVN